MSAVGSPSALLFYIRMMLVDVLRPSLAMLWARRQVLEFILLNIKNMRDDERPS